MSRKDMLADLKRSGLTTADATKLKYKALTKQQTKNLVGKKLDSYEIPYFDIKGKPIGYRRVRFLEKEKRMGKEVDTIKYSQPKDSGIHLYLPPLIKWNDIAKDVEQSIVFTEGEKKAAKACKEGLPCIGLGGVWSFRSKKQGKLLIDDFKQFEWKEREVLLIFDSDLETNPKVLQALIAFGHELSNVGAMVYLTYLPAKEDEKVGLDDYLLKHSVEDLLSLDYEEFSRSRELWQLNDEMAVIENLGKIMVLGNRSLHSKNDIVGLIYADRKITIETDKGIKEESAAGEWVKWPMRRSHSSLEYAPGQPEVLESGALNTWEGWGCEPKKGSIKPFLKLLDHVITDPEFKAWFLQWLAYPLQNPSAKLYTSVLIHGRNHGTGKSLIGYIVGKIYGKNFKMVEQEDIHGSFNDWAVNKQFILGEEITGSDRRRDADKLKNMITRERVSVNQKYVPSYEVADCINYLFTSNHADAFFLEDNDRRNAIYETDCLPMTNEEYIVIDKWYRGEGVSGLFHYLLNEVDCSDFNPRAPAPMTNSKQDMIELSRSDLDSFAHNLLEDPDHILIYEGMRIDRDLYTVDEIVGIYDNEGLKKTSNIAMSKSLRRAGFKQLPVTTTKSGAKRLWPLRNQEDWYRANHHQRVADYDKSVVMLDKARKKFKESKK